MQPLCFQGRPASPGFAAGLLHRLQTRNVAAAARNQGTAEAEAKTLRQAIAAALEDLQRLAQRLDGEAADMVAFQIAMLEDPALSDPAFEAVEGGKAADSAWCAAFDEEIAGYMDSEDEYFRARASDLADIRDRVLTVLHGVAAPAIMPGQIVLAKDLTPSLFLATNWAGGGIALLEGSPTSHVAMLARARGIPMVVGLEGLPDSASNGVEALLDGASGTLILSPDDAAVEDFEHSRLLAALQEEAARAILYQPARMADGTAVAVLLNVADPDELDGLDPEICDGIGLVRTELLFEGASPPDEQSQLALYQKIIRWAAGRPVTIRTLDAGGDKPIAGLTTGSERNPFLGVRGIRLSLRNPGLFKIQLRALARAAAEGQVGIMLPMISVPDELEAARSLLKEACRELATEGIAYREPVLGIMVEVPAAAVMPERFNAGFYSIGSNDLVQYTLAASRDAAALADLASPADPSVLKLIANVAAHGARTGRKVSLCGDAGGNPSMIPYLLDTGLRALSMAPSQIGAAKLAISTHRPPDIT